MKRVLFLLICISLCFLLIAEASQIPEKTDFIFEEEPSSELSREDKSDTSFFSSFFREPVRFTLKHEVSYKAEDPAGIINNRSSFRLEYSKFFLNYFYLQFDSKINAFWSNDHRSEAEDEKVLFEPSFREAFLQTSFGDTSIKAGVQILIWGESDGGAITDVISPRNYSELFSISLEESRIGQLMVTIDQFSPIGDWSLFFVPDPDFNEYPEKGTEYYFDPFNDSLEYRDEKPDKDPFEYGMRWKKTFGKSDISLMAASLIDNDYANRLDGYTIIKVKKRYALAGMTFNYAIGNFLFKGEAGYKAPKAFNNASFQIVEKDIVDSSLGLEYAPGGGSLTLTLEAINNHVINWSDEILGVPKASNSVIIGASDKFLKDDLSINWMTIYCKPYTSYLHTLSISYLWNDNITFYFDAYYPDAYDDRSGYWIYRDQKQIVFKTQYQF